MVCERSSAKTAAMLTSAAVFISHSMQMQTWFLSLGHHRFIHYFLSTSLDAM
jgi:hypothetical protein